MDKVEFISGWTIVKNETTRDVIYPGRKWYLSRVGTASTCWSQNRQLCGIWLTKELAETAARNLGMGKKDFTAIAIERAQPYKDPFNAA